MRLSSAHNDPVDPDPPAADDAQHRAESTAESAASEASAGDRENPTTETDDPFASPHTLRQWSFLRRIPPPVRKPLVVVMGATLIVTGMLLVVLPGPFTLPLVIAGVAILSTEFVWASRVFAVGHHHTRRLLAKTRNPWVMAGLIVLGLALAATGYSVLVAPRLS